LNLKKLVLTFFASSKLTAFKKQRDFPIPKEYQRSLVEINGVYE
jgi:hypothetical protein